MIVTTPNTAVTLSRVEPNLAQIMLAGQPTDLFVQEAEHDEAFYNPFSDAYQACVVDNNDNLVSSLRDGWDADDLLRVVLDVLAQGMQCRAEHSEAR